jgi:hypothetical protein
MAGNTQRSSQKLDARKWYLGNRACRQVAFADDTAGDQAGQSFDVNVIDGDNEYVEKKYLFWLDDGVASAPTPGVGQTLQAVTYSQGDSAIVIGSLFQAAVDALEMNATDNRDGSVIYENSFLGAITEEERTNAALLTFEDLRLGSGGFLGALDQGGASLSSEVTALEIKADDTYEVVLDKILQGTNVTIEMPLAEMSDANWQNIIGDGYGDSYTSGSDTLVGWGTSKLGQSAFQYTKQLVGHPVAKPFTERDQDIVMWACVPELNGINFSGTDKQVGEATFPALQDNTKPAEIDLAARGDHSLI